MSDKKILIVDDTGTMRLFIKLILSREGYAAPFPSAAESRTVFP